MVPMNSPNTYVGRFAPSPTGPLHFGSLVAALASFLDARANQGKWLLRVEDLDPPRESTKAPSQILEQLCSFGLEWDDKPLFQSHRLDAYNVALQTLSASNLVFGCTCSRKSVNGVYQGTCRNKPPTDDKTALRLLVSNEVIQFQDQIQGLQRFQLEKEVGDFIIKRKDGLFAYQLAVVVDDQYQGINHVIRGSDLLDSTPRQIYLARCLHYQTKTYAHFPVVLGGDGHKLSKQTHAAPIATEDPADVIKLALLALGQLPVERAPISTMLANATRQWSLKRIPEKMDITFNSLQQMA